MLQNNYLENIIKSYKLKVRKHYQLLHINSLVNSKAVTYSLRCVCSMAYVAYNPSSLSASMAASAIEVVLIRFNNWALFTPF